MYKINMINLTQHSATQEQLAAGVFDLSNEERKILSGLLTFVGMPSRDDVVSRARAISAIADGVKFALIGGAPYLMSALEDELMLRGITPKYSFTERVSVESIGIDGAVTKTSIFRHVGFVPVY